MNEHLAAINARILDVVKWIIAALIGVWGTIMGVLIALIFK